MPGKCFPRILSTSLYENDREEDIARIRASMMVYIGRRWRKLTELGGLTGLEDCRRVVQGGYAKIVPKSLPGGSPGHPTSTPNRSWDPPGAPQGAQEYLWGVLERPPVRPGGAPDAPGERPKDPQGVPGHQKGYPGVPEGTPRRPKSTPNRLRERNCR